MCMSHTVCCLWILCVCISLFCWCFFCIIYGCVRDRPFNLQGEGVWFFVSFRIFFSDNTRVRIFIFFQNLTSNYFCFPPPNSEYFFQQHWESEYFFRKKTITCPWKLNGPSLTVSLYFAGFFFALFVYMSDISAKMLSTYSQ
jgi:hypothetical protein